MILKMPEIPPVAVMRRLVAMHNKDLKIKGAWAMKKADLHALVKKSRFNFHKLSANEWELRPQAQMKRQKAYKYNKTTKAGSKKTHTK